MHPSSCIPDFIFWLCHVACGILVTQPGTEPVPPAVEAQCPDHWTAKGIPFYFNGEHAWDSITNSTDINLGKLRETVRARKAWRAAVHGIAKSQIWLSDWTTTCLGSPLSNLEAYSHWAVHENWELLLIKFAPSNLTLPISLSFCTWQPPFYSLYLWNQFLRLHIKMIPHGVCLSLCLISLSTCLPGLSVL